jgi:hypothetical protein
MRCRYICSTGMQCKHNAVIDGLCMKHFTVEYELNKIPHIDYKQYSMSINIKFKKNDMEE